MSPHSAQMLVSKNHSHMQGIKAPWKKRPFPGLWQRKPQDEPGASYYACKQESAKIFWEHNKESQGQAEEVPAGQFWNNLSTKIVIVTLLDIDRTKQIHVDTDK